MKLSDNTLAVLKNFSSINSGMVLNKGTVQKTMAPDKAVLAEATIEDTIPYQLGIYDLNQFLGNISALENPEMEFHSNRVVMDNGQIYLNYYSSPINTIITPPEKELVMKNVDVSFSVTNNILQTLLRLAAMNNLTHLSVVGKNGEIRLQTHDKASDTSNYASFKLNDFSGEDFIAPFKVENIKFVPTDYDVEIQLGAFAKFTVNTGAFKDKIKYWVALEAK